MGPTNEPLMYHSPRVSLKEANRFKGCLTTAKICTTLSTFLFLWKTWLSHSNQLSPYRSAAVCHSMNHLGVGVVVADQEEISSDESHECRPLVSENLRFSPSLLQTLATTPSPRGNLQHILGRLWKSQVGELCQVQSTVAGKTQWTSK